VKVTKKTAKKIKSFTFTGTIRELEEPTDAEKWESYFDVETTGGSISVSVLCPRLSYWRDGRGDLDRADRDCAERLASDIAEFLQAKGFRIPYREDYDLNPILPRRTP